jgi:voltage-gated potassium channel
MEGSSEEHWAGRAIERRIEKRGLRPRVAASVIAIIWVAAVVVFGIAEHLADPDSFDNIWLGMWWATQTVTTVGYGDVVPDQTAGQLIATVLMIGGLSLFAVLTGFITSAFVARAQAATRGGPDDPVMLKLIEIETRLETIKAEVGRLSGDAGEQDPEPDR